MNLAAKSALAPAAAGVDSAPHSLADLVFHERVSGARDEIPPIAFLIVVGALSLGWVLRNSIPVDELYLWVTLQTAFAGCCAWLAQAYRADENRVARARVWAVRMNGMVIVGGLLWSWVAVWLATMDHPLLQLVAGAILVGVPLLGVTTNRYFAAGQAGLVIVFLGSFVGYLAFVSTADLRLEIAVGCVIYAVVMIWMGVRAQLATVSLLTAQLQREGLIDQLQRAKDRSESADRAKSQFVANVSHELRTPLTVVLGMAQLLSLSELDAEQREGVDMIERSGQALLSLVNHILDLSRIESGGLKLEDAEFDIRKTVAGVQRHFADEAAAKGLAFSVRIEHDVPQYVQGDELRLRQVLLNLCDNAVKFTSAGRVDLSVKVFGEERPAGRIVLGFAVADTGVGMDKAAAAKAFEPFFQVHTSAERQFGGTGLGLAISRRLARLMGGTISVDSEPGRGSTFSFTAAFLPVAAQPGAQARARVPSGERLALRVLLVEDNPINSLVGSSLLRTLATEVDVAEGGEEALRAIEAQPYDVILMDCTMRGVDGCEAAHRIRSLERTGTLPRRSHIVALTANALPEDRERALASGMDAYVTKPYTLEDLKEALLGAGAGR